MSRKTPGSSPDEVFVTCHGPDTKNKKAFDNYREISDYLNKIEQFGVDLSADKKTFLLKTIKAALESLATMKEMLVESAKVQLSARQSFVLETNEDAPVMDPSVQFFGIEWTRLLKRWQKVGKKLPIYIESLESRKVDVVLLISILKQLDQIKMELQHHQVAITSNQLTDEHLQKQLNSQRRVSNIGEKARLERASQSHLAPEKGGYFSEKLRRKSFNINPTIGLSIQHSLKRRPSHVPKNELSPEPHVELTRRKSTQESSMKSSIDNISLVAALPCGVKLTKSGK